MLYLIEGYGKTGKLLKIGYSQSVEVRMDQFNITTPDFKLLATREGDEKFEDKLHEQFKSLSYNGSYEWFYYDEKIIEGFKTLQEENLISSEEYDKIELRSDKLKERILSEFKVGNWYSDIYIKRKFYQVYRELGYKGSFEANDDINKYFETKPQDMIHPHPSGMHVDGLVILSKKDQ